MPHTPVQNEIDTIAPPDELRHDLSLIAEYAHGGLLSLPTVRRAVHRVYQHLGEDGELNAERRGNGEPFPDEVYEEGASAPFVMRLFATSPTPRDFHETPLGRLSPQNCTAAA